MSNKKLIKLDELIMRIVYKYNKRDRSDEWKCNKLDEIIDFYEQSNSDFDSDVELELEADKECNQCKTYLRDHISNGYILNKYGTFCDHECYIKYYRAGRPMKMKYQIMK